MAAATGARSSPTSRSLSSARLTAASSSGMVVGPASLATGASVALSAGAGFNMKLLIDAVNRCHELIGGSSSSAASGSGRAMREATSVDHLPKMPTLGPVGIATRRNRAVTDPAHPGRPPAQVDAMRSCPSGRSTGPAFPGT